MKTILEEWDLKYVKIQTNVLIAAQRPTTQDDGYGQIVDRMDLYHQPNQLLNGVLSNMKEGKDSIYKCGHLVEYVNGNFAIFYNSLRIDLSKFDVEFIK